MLPTASLSGSSGPGSQQLFGESRAASDFEDTDYLESQLMIFTVVVIIIETLTIKPATALL